MEKVTDTFQILAILMGIALLIGILRFIAQVFLGMKLNEKGSFMQLFQDINDLKFDESIGFFTLVVSVIFVAPFLILLRLIPYFLYNIVFLLIVIGLIYVFNSL